MSDNDDSPASPAAAHSDELLKALWAEAVLVSNQKPESIPVSLFAQSVNDVTDYNEKRRIADHNRVPPVTFLLLFAMSAVAVGFTGYAAGLLGTRQTIPNAIIAVSIAVVTMLIADLDRPKHGLITVDRQALIDVKNSFLRNSYQDARKLRAFAVALPVAVLGQKYTSRESVCWRKLSGYARQRGQHVFRIVRVVNPRCAVQPEIPASFGFSFQKGCAREQGPVWSATTDSICRMRQRFDSLGREPARMPAARSQANLIKISLSKERKLAAVSCSKARLGGNRIRIAPSFCSSPPISRESDRMECRRPAALELVRDHFLASSPKTGNRSGTTAAQRSYVVRRRWGR